MQTAARIGASYLNHDLFGMLKTPATRKLAAAWEVFSRMRLTHQRPSFGFDSVQVGERQVPVREVSVHTLPFCTLQRFVRDDLGDQADADRPKVLIVAPLSGHFATLLHDTVRTMLPTTTSTSPTGTTPATCRWPTAASGWTNTSTT